MAEAKDTHCHNFPPPTDGLTRPLQSYYHDYETCFTELMFTHPVLLLKSVRNIRTWCCLKIHNFDQGKQIKYDDCTNIKPSQNTTVK